MRDDEIRARLRLLNPWWSLAAGAFDVDAFRSSDPLLRARRTIDLGHRSPILHDIISGPVSDLLVVLRGPRRVGKSVAVKDAVAELCGRPDLDPKQVIYASLDGATSRDLNRFVVLATDMTRSIGERPRVWMLDEITAVLNWTAALKFLRDNTTFGNDTVVCTGSSWDARSEVERDLLAGRSGVAPGRRLRLVMPMSFREVVSVTRPHLPLGESIEPWDLQSQRSAETITVLEHSIDELDLAWQSYLSSGGFPRAVTEYDRRSAVSDEFADDLLAWLHRDVDDNGPDESVPLLLWELQRRSSSPLNRTRCAEALSFPNRASFDTRLTRLVHSFAANWCHQVDDHGRQVVGSQSKVYLSDPLLAWLPAQRRAGLTAPDFGPLTEAALANHLARAVDRNQSGRWYDGDAIGYLRTGGGKEVDLAAVPVTTVAGPQATTPIEVKWVAKGWRGESRVITGKYQRGIVATKDVIDVRGPVWAVPAPILALLLA